MYIANRTMTLQDRTANYQVQKAPCPQFELQPGNPRDLRLSIHFPRTGRDKEELLSARKAAWRRGAMVSVAHQYLWNLALLVESCNTYNIDKLKWNDSRLPAVKLSRALSHICQQDKSFAPDNGGYIRLVDILI